MTRLSDIREPLELFRGMFAAELPVDDRMDFYASRRTQEGDTFLRLESYAPPSLSRLVLEEYEIRGRMRGTVIMAFPRPDTEVPIFFFQLGGVGDRSIAVLDISPTTPDLDLSPLAPVCEKYRELLGMEPTSTGWLQTICSPYLLHCNYSELDGELFVEAMGEYCRVWMDHYYLPRPPTGSERRAEMVTNALYEFKYQLHHHDPAYEFFTKSWGKPAADAFLDLECGDDPAFLPPEEFASKVKPWQDIERNLVWDERAQRAVMDQPSSEQDSWRATVEEGAVADGFGIITSEMLDRYGPIPSTAASD